MTVLTWRFSTILSNVWPVCFLFGIFGVMVARLPPLLLPRINPLPLALQGTAIGLLLGACRHCDYRSQKERDRRSRRQPARRQRTAAGRRGRLSPGAWLD